MKHRARKKTNDWVADFGCDDIQELMKSCTPPCATPARPQEDSVRGAIENGGYRILWFLWEERPKGTDCEIIGCTHEDVTLLMQAQVLKPLGKPGQNAPKCFCSVEIVQLAADRKWLDDVTKTLSQYWRRKRERRSSRGESSGSAGESSRQREGKAES